MNTNFTGLLAEIENAVLSEVDDASKYVIIQVGEIEHKGETVVQLSYHMNKSCPQYKQDKIVQAILKIAEELSIPIVTPHLPE